MELIPFDINADFEKWDITNALKEKAIDYHIFKSGIAVLWYGNELPQFYTFKYHVNNDPLHDLFLTPKVKKQYQNQYEEGFPGFWYNSIDELKKAQSPQVNVIGIIERTLSPDNKLIDAKIVEG